MFLEAKQLGREYTRESLERSNQLLQQALEIDPGYTSARLALSGNKRRLQSFSLDQDQNSVTENE